MRVVFFILAVAGVSSMRMGEVSHDELAKAAGSSMVGQTLLMQIQEHIAQGGPIEELREIVEQVTQRIIDAGKADTTQHTQLQENCTIDIAEYNRKIAAAKAEIAKTKGEINQAEADYNKLKAEIVELEAAIAELTADIQQLMTEIEDGRTRRAGEHERFVNLSTDSTSVIAAVEEIRGLEVGSTLQQAFPDADVQHVEAVRAAEADRDAQQGGKTGNGALDSGDRDRSAANDAAHDADVSGTKAETTNVETERFNENEGFDELADSDRAKYALVQLASQATDPHMTALLQVAAAAVKAIGDDDLKKLLDLLDELLEELRQYTDELISAEKTAALDWANEEASLTAELRAKQNTKHQKQDTLQETYRAKRDKAGDIHNLRMHLDEVKGELINNERLLADRIAECNALRVEYERRTAERSEELKTIQDIAGVIENKLKTAGVGNAHVNARLNRS